LLSLLLSFEMFLEQIAHVDFTEMARDAVDSHFQTSAKALGLEGILGA
jgi:hypothetical protein